MQQTVGTGYVVKVVGCSDKTVKDWCKQGKLKGHRNLLTGRWEIDLDSVNALLASVKK